MPFDKFQVLRSHNNKRRFLIIACSDTENAFDSHVPQPTRALGPWTCGERQPLARMQLMYRAALARDGYVLIEHHAAVLDPTAKTSQPID